MHHSRPFWPKYTTRTRACDQPLYAHAHSLGNRLLLRTVNEPWNRRGSTSLPRYEVSATGRCGPLRFPLEIGGGPTCLTAGAVLERTVFVACVKETPDDGVGRTRVQHIKRSEAPGFSTVAAETEANTMYVHTTAIVSAYISQRGSRVPVAPSKRSRGTARQFQTLHMRASPRTSEF